MSAPASRRLINGVRYYEIAGRSQLYPSVTSILGIINKKFLNRWETTVALDLFRARLLERLRAQQSFGERDVEQWMSEAHAQPGLQTGAASNFGSQAHDLFEVLAKGQTPASIPASLSTVAGNFRDWLLAQQGLSIVSTELTVWSDQHLFAGTADALARRSDGRLVLLDWKTGNRVYGESAMQVAAYAKAYEEMHGEPVAEAWVVRFERDQRKLAQPKVVADLDSCFDTFRSAAKLWHSVKVDPFAPKQRT